MVDVAVDSFGRLDVLYNNAAIQMSGRLVDCTEEQWDITIATNLERDLLGVPGGDALTARG